MTENNEKLAKLYDEAFANPGTPQPIGDIVVCDLCSGDYTNKAAQGGMIAGSKAVCPQCSSSFKANLIKYGEEGYIKAECPIGTSFADFVRKFRGPHATIQVTAFGSPKSAVAPSHCIQCKEPFSQKNVHTRAGWAEIRISGMCEDCFDGIFAEAED